jgi:uncharacterized protein (TIGR03437 family)
VNDTYGVDDIRSVNIFFTGATGGCVFAVQPASGNLLLKNDAGNAWLDPITSGTVSNSKCFFNAAGTSWTAASATELDITMQLGFTAASAGDYQISVQPFGAPSVSAVPVGVGDWTVNPLPSISANGIVPIYSSAQTIQPGSWISIFGNSLAAGTATWNNDFPTKLGGTSVTIDGKPAYLWYVSPTQINLQAPDDDTAGPVEVVVTTPAGTATSTVTLGRYAPSFSLLDGKHIAGIILRPDGSGAYGNGAYDILGPTGDSLGYKTVAARAGDILELFGVGFGPTNPVAPAGKAYSGAAPAVEPVTLSINNTVVTPDFCGITAAGLFQINIVRLPDGLGSGDAPVKATVGGQQTAEGPVISLQ